MNSSLLAHMTTLSAVVDRAAVAFDGTAVSPSLLAQGHIAPPPATALHSGNRGRRVLYIVDTLNIGGTETQMAETAMRLRAAGCDVTVACLRAEGPLLEALCEAGVPVVEFRKEKSLVSLNGVRQFLRLARFLRQKKFQVVHAHDLWSNLFGVPAAWLARTPVIISSRRYQADLEWYRPWKARIVNALYRLSTYVVVNSASVRKLLLERDGLPAQKVRVIYNAVDVERISRIRPHWKNLRFMAPGSTPIAVVANMYSSVKGHTNLIAAAEILCRVRPEAFFLLIGDGPERPRLEEQVRAKNLEQNFLFMGRRTDVPELLACCNLSVLPSEAEALPNALLEAMSAGLPVVATRVGGVPEIIGHGVHGLLVPPKDPEALAAAILHVMNDPHFAIRLARAGQERMRTDFSFDRLMRELEQLYAVEQAASRFGPHGDTITGWTANRPESPGGEAVHA